MPEIPELEVLKENLCTSLDGKSVKGISILKPYIQKTLVPADIADQRVTGVERRAKYISVVLERHRITVHLMLAGRFKLIASDRKAPASSAALIEFEDATSLALAEEGSLKKMCMWVFAEPETIDDLKELGPEPLSQGFTLERLEALLSHSAERIKNFLLNQVKIAGIGNAYSDEILWRARLSPAKQASKLSHEDAEALYNAIRSALLEAIEETRRLTGAKIEINETRPFMNVHRRKGEPCPRCGTRIEWVSTTSRDTFYCPKCQTGGRVLADNRTSKFLK